jgi:hypothetical protein
MRAATDELSLDVRLRRPSQRHERPPRRRPGRVGRRARRQRSTVKVAYVRKGKAGAWRAHGAYLAREGAQRTGEKGLGFDASHDDIDLTSTLGTWQAAGNARLWKAIVSPEQAARLDLRAHVRALVAQMEQDLGRARMGRDRPPRYRQSARPSPDPGPRQSRPAADDRSDLCPFKRNVFGNSSSPQILNELGELRLLDGLYATHQDVVLGAQAEYLGGELRAALPDALLEQPAKGKAL